LKINPSIVQKIQNSDPTWNGIALNSFTGQNLGAGSYIAACGVNTGFALLCGTPSAFAAYATKTFNLYANYYYATIYTANDWANIMTHELGHALGIGFADGIFNRPWRFDSDNYFIAASGGNYGLVATTSQLSAAYSNIVGSSRSFIPVEDTGGAGTAGAHWENSYRASSYHGSRGLTYPGLYNELMIGYYSQFITYVMSPMTIKALIDFGLGYKEITPGASEGNPTTVNSLLPLSVPFDAVSYGDCTCKDVVGSPTIEYCSL
jgi:hypothetical protein